MGTAAIAQPKESFPIRSIISLLLAPYSTVLVVVVLLAV